MHHVDPGPPATHCCFGPAFVLATAAAKATSKAAVASVKLFHLSARCVDHPPAPALTPAFSYSNDAAVTSTHHGLHCCVLQAINERLVNDASVQGSEQQQPGNSSGIVSLMQAWGHLSTRLQQPAAPAEPAAGAAAGSFNAALQDDATQLILSALKLAVRSLSRVPAAADGSGSAGGGPASSNRPAVQRSLALAAALAELYASGLPLDAASIAAGIVAEAVDVAALHIRSVQAKLGPEVAGLVHDVLAVRHATDRVQLYDDANSRCVGTPSLAAGVGCN